jgi:putative DNA primase/helicase
MATSTRQPRTRERKNGSATGLLPQHAALLRASGISKEVSAARGYRSARTAADLAALGFRGAQGRLAPALAIPIRTPDGRLAFWQLRPDTPRTNGDGKPARYEVMAGARLVLDVPPSVNGQLRDPKVPLWVTEGARKADAAVSRGLCCLDLVGGVWGWRGSNEEGGKTALADWEAVALNGRTVYLAFDSDATTKREVHAALARLKAFLESRGAGVRVVYLPAGTDGAKVGLDDFLAAGHTVKELLELATEDLRPPAAGLFRTTEGGAAERFAAQHGERIRYVHDWRRWCCWDGRHWQRDADGEAARLARETVRDLYGDAATESDPDKRKALVRFAAKMDSSYGIRAMLDLAQSERSAAATSQTFDRDGWLRNCENGTLDLRTAHLRAHRRADLLTHLLPVAYDPGARAPRWERFLDEVFGRDRDLVGFIRRAVGYSLTGETKEQCFFLLHGLGANGKSTFLETVRALLGDLAQTARFESFLERRGEGIRNDIARMRGARFVTACEAEGEKRLAETVVKQLTGGDTVAARFLYQEDFEFRPQFKLWLAANHKPVVRGTDLALWRRVKLVPFVVTIPEPERDPDLSAKLRAELPGVLAWAVAGCRAWQRDGLGTCRAVEVATQGYRTESDILGNFLSEMCALGPTLTVARSLLYGTYHTWAQANGFAPMSAQTFAQRLVERSDGISEFRTKKEGKCWKGIALRLSDPATARY